jgi:hypothetical protein
MQFAITADEHLLGDVLGESVISDQMDQVSPDRSLHDADHLLERSDVTGGGCLHVGDIGSIHVFAASCAAVRMFIHIDRKCRPQEKDVLNSSPVHEAVNQPESEDVSRTD